MASQPIDQGAVLSSGAGAVQNYAQQALQQAMLGVQQDQARTMSASQQRLQAADNREVARQSDYQQALAALGPNPSLSGLLSLMARFPEASEALKRNFDAMQGQQREREFSSIAQVHSALVGGHPEVAARILRERIQAETQGGQEPDPIDTQMLAAIESGDPQQIATARTMARRAAAIAAGPERFAAIYGADDSNITVIDGTAFDNDTRMPVFQTRDPRIIPGPNGSFYQADRAPLSAYEVQPATQGAQAGPVTTVAPSAGAREDGGAFDFGANPPGNIPSGSPLSPGGPNLQAVRIRSRQEWERLPPGTPFIDPQGRQGIKGYGASR